MTTKAARGVTQTRREMLVKAAAAALAATGVAPAGFVFAQTYAQSPGQTQGPYWLDNMPERKDIRSNTSNGVVQSGFKTQLGVNVSQLSGGNVTPVTGAKVDIWHCSASGLYSGVSQNGTLGQNFLRGYQLTNSHGNARFITIYPGWYSGRTVHIHFRVRLYAGATVTYNFVSQLYTTTTIDNQVFATSPYNARPNRDTFNTTDMIYTGGSQGTGGSVSSNSGAYLLLRLAKRSSVAVASFNVVL
jgi:protocatechuate 3,4-dioxygenase beta subunit